MQFGVSISTKESDLNIVYGMYNLREESEFARASVKYIYTDLNAIQTNYFRLGFHLSEFESMEYYKDFGYLTFSEFVEANLSMDKSAASRCINVFREFCQKEYDCTGCLKRRSNHIDDKYEDYSYSQLCEMLPMSEDARKKVTPAMSVKQIREIKKVKNVSREKENVSQVATSQPEEKPKKDLSKVVSLHGSARQSFVKSLSVADLEEYHYPAIYLFDSDGKPLPFEYGFGCCGYEIYHNTENGCDALYFKLSTCFPEEKEGAAHD